MTHKFFKIAVAAVATLTAGVLLAACSSNGSSSNKSSSTAKVTTINVGLDGSTQPFEYTKNGELTGYDVAVAKAVFAKLPQYKLNFQIMDFNSIATSIDNGRIQMGANDFGWNAARAEKYYFTSPVSKSNNAVAVRSSDNSKITDLSSLAGMKTEGEVSSNYTSAIQTFNKSASKPIDISYISGQTPFSNRLTDIVNGKIDFVLYDKISLKSTIDQLGFDSKLKIKDVSMSSSNDAHEGYEYFLLPKTAQGKTLQSDINKVLKELAADGTLKKYSEQYFGGDFVPESSLFTN